MVGSDRQKTYGNSIYPFNTETRERVLAKIRALPDSVDPRWGWNARRVLFFLYHTGCHPEVLVHPSTRHLAVREGRIVWARPKTGQFIGLPIPDEIRPWVEEFIASLQETTVHRYSERSYTVKENGGEERTRQQDVCSLVITKMVGALMDEWGFTGVTARTFRHDKARRVFLVRKELADVRRYIGVTPEVAIRYAEDIDPEVEAALRKG